MAKVKHIAIATQNPDETAKFYTEVLGLQEVGKIDGENAEGYYLSDGSVHIAILKFKNEAIAGERGSSYSGIHHIGFQVDDAEATDAKMRAAKSFPMDEINAVLHAGTKENSDEDNVELKYSGPDNVMLDISQNGWVGTKST